MASKDIKKQTQKDGIQRFSVNSFESVIVRPRITEKASFQAQNNVYIFDVARDATKRSIFSAIKKIYSVVPLKIRVTQIPSKTRLVRGKKGVKSGGKKAYVYLKKGDKIEVM